MIVRQTEPLNLETPPDALTSFLTPQESFYIRCHFPIPDLHKSSYRLEIAGAVRQPRSFSFEEICSLPGATVTATMECAGNGRVFLTPEAQGAQWSVGAVGTAEWTGVPLSTLLSAAGLEEDASEVILEGADRGKPKEEPVPPGEISYGRSLPRQHALRPEVLIAYRMNGQELRKEHGYPVRAIVPGYYGMASVKWLARIYASRAPFSGYFQTSDYAFWDRVDGHPVRRPLGQMGIKSQITHPSSAETLLAGRPYAVRGLAWSGNSMVAKVELSSDDGRNWTVAEFLDEAQPHCWRRWQCVWNAPSVPGRVTLMSRATDASGNCQPDAHDPNLGSYVIHQQIPVHVTVSASPETVVLQSA